MGRLRLFSKVLLAVLTPGVGVASAFAQTSVVDVPEDVSGDGVTRGREAEAREFFEQANQALIEGRAEDACDLFQRSLNLHPTVPARYNLAVALRIASRPLEARTILQSLLDQAYGPLAPGQREAVTTALDGVRQELATLHVTVRGVGAARIDVDGETVAAWRGTTPVEVPVLPGRHAVVADAPQGTAEEWVDATRGTLHAIDLTIVPSAPAPAAPPPSRSPSLYFTDGAGSEVSSSDGGSEWVWVVGSVAVAATAAVVTALIMSSTSGPRDPVSGDIDGAVETLRW